MSDTETVTLDLDGNFADGARESIAAADALTAAMGRFAEASERIKDPKWAQADKISAITSELNQQASLTARIAAFDASRLRALDAQEKIYRKMREDALGITAENARLEQMERNQRSIGDATKETESSIGASTIALGAAGLAAHALYSEIKSAYEQTVAFEESWGSFGVKLAIDETSKRQVQSEAGRALGAGAGGYDSTVKMALKMGINPDAAWEQTKKLLGDKFKSEEIPALIRIKTGMDVAGQNGQGLLTELQRLKLEPKVRSADIDRLYRLGVDSKKVYAELAQEMGTTVPIATAKVKKGLVDTEEVLKVIEKVAQDKYGGLSDILGNSVPALIARVKADLEHLTDGVNLDPLRMKLKEVVRELEGREGGELKYAVNNLFGAITDTSLGDIHAKDISSMFHQVAEGVNDAASAVRHLRPEVVEIITLLERMSKDGTIQRLVQAGELAAREKGEEVQRGARGTDFRARAASSPLATIGNIWTDPIGSIMAAMGRKDPGSVGLFNTGSGEDVFNKRGGLFGMGGGAANDQVADKTTSALSLGGTADSMHAQGADVGQAINDGVAEGIAGGVDGPLGEVAALGDQLIAELRAKLQSHSPSEAFAEIGDDVPEGAAVGVKRSTGAATGAVGDMAAGMLGAGGGAAGGGGGASAGSYTFAPQITLPPGSPAATTAAVNAALAAAYPQFLEMVRRAQREARAS